MNRHGDIVVIASSFILVILTILELAHPPTFIANHGEEIVTKS